MADPKNREARAAFLKTFRKIARHKHRYDVFRDFVTLAACSLHNAAIHDTDREEEYLELIRVYDPEDQKRFPELLAHLIETLEDEPRDILGQLFMELEIANKDAGQFFTPPEVSDAIAAITFGDLKTKLKDQSFVTLSEPACGAGGMVLSLVKLLTQGGHDPAQSLWAQCIDIDRVAALMSYVQLSLWNVPAEVIVGDTLRWEHREVWYTPAHYLGNWSARLEAHRAKSDGSGDLDDWQEGVEAASEDPRTNTNSYETFAIDWKGQKMNVRWCPEWLGGTTAHLEIVTPDRSPHPISETGYRSHFCPRVQVEEVGGPVAFVIAWLESKDDGKPVQLSLF